MQKGFAPILIVLLIGITLAAAGGAYYFGFDHGFEKSVNYKPSPTPQTTQTPTPSQHLTANWKIRSLATSSDNSKILAIKTSGEAGTFIKNLILSNEDGTNERILFSQKGVDSNSWEDVTSSNFSPGSSKFIYLLNILPDGGDIYIFKASGEKFSNNKDYLLASELGYNGLPITGISWISPTQLQIKGGVSLLIEPKTIPTYEINLLEEKLKQIN